MSDKSLYMIFLITCIWSYFLSDARDSIAKVVYGRVFGWIVSKINELLAHKLDTNVELSEIGKTLNGLYMKLRV